MMKKLSSCALGGLFILAPLFTLADTGTANITGSADMEATIDNIINTIAAGQYVDESVSATGKTELQISIDWMYANNLTKYNEPTSFGSQRFITREEAAKFYGNFAKMKGKTADTTANCTFKDDSEIDSTLKANVTEACQMGIFLGSQGKFMPKANLTYGQAITVLIRILDGKMAEPLTSAWYVNYVAKAKERGILNGMSNLDSMMNSASLRGDDAVMIYRGK